jgi:hypothetical protein
LFQLLPNFLPTIYKVHNFLQYCLTSAFSTLYSTILPLPLSCSSIILIIPLPQKIFLLLSYGRTTNNTSICICHEDIHSKSSLEETESSIQ